MTKHERFAFWAACVVAPLAIFGSAVALYRIARELKLDVPLALPVVLDLAALVAAAQIRARRHLVLGWMTLIGGVFISGALQVADVWSLGPKAWVVHGALPLGALVVFELAMPDGKTEKPKVAAAKPKAPPKPEPKPEPLPPAASLDAKRHEVEMTDNEIVSALRVHFKETERAPSKRSVMAAVRTSICGTEAEPGKCSDRTALRLLSKLNELEQTGT